MVAPLAALRAQEPPALPADVDATIRAAAAQKNHEMLDKAALGFEGRQSTTSLISCWTPRCRLSRDIRQRSSAYGLGLLKIADLERQRNRLEEARRTSTDRALHSRGDRAESAPALSRFGRHEKDPQASFSVFRGARAQIRARRWLSCGRLSPWKQATEPKQRTGPRWPLRVRGGRRRDEVVRSVPQESGAGRGE